MYKSSPLTFVFKYIFPPFMIFGMLFGIYIFWDQGTPESQGIAKGFAIMSVWVAVFLVQMPFRLKTIETTSEGILIKDDGKTWFVEYRHLQWISKYDLASPWAVTIKYREQTTGVDRKVSFMPGQSDQRMLKNDAMTQFIHDKILANNPDYSKDDQPNAIKNFVLTLLLNLPFLLLFLHFSGYLEQLIQAWKTIIS